MIKGWCPGALRPMQSGDGLIVRLRITGGIVVTGLAAAIARWSRRWGNGQIDLTGRANLQLRGLSTQCLPELYDAISEWSLLDDDAAAEAIRNVISSPLAGLDPDAILDVRPIARALEQRLAGDTALHDLPAKFGFAVDDGGRFSLDGVAADVWFVACRLAGRTGFEIRLAGAPRKRFGPCSPAAVADVAAALGRVFLHWRKGGGSRIRRMRDLVGLCGAETITRAAGLAHGDSAALRIRRSGCLGVQPLGDVAVLGVGLPFGRIVAEDFAELVSATSENGGWELRLTPWRAILVPLPSRPAAHALSAALPAESLIRDPDDLRLRIAACPGAPSCAQATTLVRDDAAMLAGAVAGASGCGTILHVSGCDKGCAHPGPAPVTLVARQGRYHLVRNGIASNAPALAGLTLDQAAEQVRQVVAGQSHRGTA